MSDIQEAKGGDGWSSWTIEREPAGNYFAVVVSRAERNPDGTDKVLYISEDIRNGQSALDAVISVSARYAHRMAS